MTVLNNSTIRDAFTKLGERLRLERDVEILIVGGAAGVLTYELPPAWTTADVDAFHFELAKDREAVLSAGEEVGRELKLPSDWLNDWGGKYTWTLPDDWQSRRIKIGEFGRLRVYAVSRIDLISMKFIGHRERDLEHLQELKVTSSEKEVVQKYLEVLTERYPAGRYPEEAGRIELARTYLDNWEIDT
ncbi:MAG: hypothetical protein H0T11_08330 [Chthoniobacterales bacterium]|nr:hypothetical protein [Chthoniobacterales bacterium]